jgi:hypothetical protein
MLQGTVRRGSIDTQHNERIETLRKFGIFATTFFTIMLNASMLAVL